MLVRKLEPHFVPKVWGATQLEPWFPNPSERIGEVWFEATEHACPLLIKFLFTTEPLSVQVHPNDDYAREHENSRGKTEMWHILRAEPDAAVALGFTRELSPEELSSASQTGAIEQLLQWLPVAAGDTVFTPAGTVHAIGAGIALCEIQQRSDVTYRLYDYGRPRELHLDRSVAVAHRGPYVNELQRATLAPGATQLVNSSFFITSKLSLPAATSLPPISGTSETLIVLSGKGTVDGLAFRAGEALRVATRTEALQLTTDSAAELLHTYYPGVCA